MVQNDDNGGLPDLSQKRLLEIIMQEIADNRREILEYVNGKFQDIDRKFDMVMQELRSFREEMIGEIRSFRSEFNSFRNETHQNMATFIYNHDALDKRVTKLELASAK